MRSRVPIGTHAVVLSVPDEATLYALAESCYKAGLRNDEYVMVNEPDLPDGEFAGEGQFTAIGFAPTIDRARLRPILGRLPLLK